MSLVAPIASHVAYCRAARRLRSQNADRPALLYQSLRRLSDNADRQPRSAPAMLLSPAERVDLALGDSIARASSAMTLTPAAMALIPMIREAFDGPILRYSARQRLVHTAERLGISRFHANLLIALVQHELQKRDPASSSLQPKPGASHRWLGRIAPIAILLALEATAAVAVWRTFHG